MARKRLELLENKFKKDELFAAKYCDKIEELFSKGYARRLSADEQKILPKTYFLPQGRGTNFNGPLQQCVMSRMLFGAACSPTIAQFIKNENARMFVEQSPRAVNAITDRHYVDDYVDCFQSEMEAIETVKEVQKIHKKAGFDLCKIISNSQKVINAFHGSQVSSVDVSTDGVERILGMHWNPTTDEFVFVLKFHRVSKDIIELRRKPTKREILSVVMSVFDPFGFLANITVAGKILMQTL